MSKHQIESIVRDLIYPLLKEVPDSTTDQAPLEELGFDSLDFFEIVLQLEEVHRISIPIEKLDKTITIQSLISVAHFKPE